jgi:geranylgeranyl pyrophosphate synthase
MGDPDAFGSGTAILLGDLCLAWSDELLRLSGLDVAALLRARPVFDLMRTEVIAGQYLDVHAQATADNSMRRASTVARFKSAKYTVERPLLLGAAIADAPPAIVEAYSRFSLPLGEAFQLRDDVLGVFGDPVRTGKPAGDDLREESGPTSWRRRSRPPTRSRLPSWAGVSAIDPWARKASPDFARSSRRPARSPGPRIASPNSPSARSAC